MNYRNAKVLAEAKHHSCQLCGADDGTIVAAHSNRLIDGKGMGIKAHDLPAYLCHGCHAAIDQGGWSKRRKEMLWELARDKSVPLYWHLLDDEGKRLLREGGYAGHPV